MYNVPINDNDKLRTAYEMLRSMGDECPEFTQALKRGVREYTHRAPSDYKYLEDEYDGFKRIELLPDWLESLEEAEEFFREWCYRKCIPSQYDCTGRSFTRRYFVFYRRGRYYAYHSVGFDV